ncbi:molybdopterin-synthase adenylyltransferase MoeB [Aquimonas sp.]|uniref:molybdopterin-synthase adenylyltransferase MoeB n=1 Tax=Aquimonas sp. TaxID=1872588 RepID=UPI0037BEC22D
MNRVIELDPEEALLRQGQGALLVDVRENSERAAGLPVGAIALPLGQVAARIHEHADTERELLLICAAGARSLRAATQLQALGYARVASIRGGCGAWRVHALPWAQALEPADFLERYDRHLRLPQVGLEGQRRLQRARVAIIGAGGLGSPVALYLAAAGVGHIRLIDDDRVDRSNLQRQVLHTEAAVGDYKVDSARERLLALNPTLDLDTRASRIDAANIERLLDGVELVIDGSDNFPTRYLISDACVQLRLPLVYGAVERFSGQVSVFAAGLRRGQSPCYRCLFPEPPLEAPNCAEAGVLGVLPGLIGMLQATEALKWLLGIGRALDGRLLSVDALGMVFRELQVPVDPECVVCAPGRVFGGYFDYEQSCSAR